MTQRITEDMIQARLHWICSSVDISLALDHNANGYTLYLADKENRTKFIKDLAFSESAAGIFQILKGIYEVVTILKEQQEKEQEAHV